MDYLHNSQQDHSYLSRIGGSVIMINTRTATMTSPEK